MSKKLNKKEIEKFSRQIILKNVGALGQKKIQEAKVLIIGMGGLGCPAAEFLTRSGIGTLGLADYDKVDLSISFSVYNVCRWIFDKATLSSSTIPSVPIPERVKNSEAGHPKPPIPIIKTLASLIFL